MLQQKFQPISSYVIFKQLNVDYIEHIPLSRQTIFFGCTTHSLLLNLAIYRLFIAFVCCYFVIYNNAVVIFIIKKNKNRS